MVAVIPSLFAIIVLVLLLMYSGADIAEKGRELLNTIPFLSEEKNRRINYLKIIKTQSVPYKQSWKNGMRK